MAVAGPSPRPAPGPTGRYLGLPWAVGRRLVDRCVEPSVSSAGALVLALLLPATAEQGRELEVRLAALLLGFVGHGANSATDARPSTRASAADLTRTARPLCSKTTTAGPARSGSGSLVCPSVGLTGFEPAASSSRTRRATKLRHSPKALGSLLERMGAPNRVSHRANAAQGSFGSSVSRVASGRQHSRTGAYGEVPAPAETCSQDEPGSPGRESAGCRCRPLARAVLEVAVGDDRALERQADLAAVGVAGEGDVVAVAGVLVEHPEVRRVRDPDAQVDVGGGRAGDRVRGRRSPGAGRRRPTKASDVSPTVSRAAGVGQVGPAASRRTRRAGPATGSLGVWVLRRPSSGKRYQSGLRSVGAK